MSKKSDDSIERFFKKAVAQQDLSHLDSDWKNMEKMLVDHTLAASAAKAGIRKKVLTYSIVGALFLSGVFFAVTRTWKSVPEDKVANKTTQTTKPSQAAAGMSGPKNETKENPSADLLPSDSKISRHGRHGISSNAQQRKGHDGWSEASDGVQRSYSTSNSAVKTMLSDNEDQPGVLLTQTPPSVTDEKLLPRPEVLNPESANVLSESHQSIGRKTSDEPAADSVGQIEVAKATDILEDKKEEEKPSVTKVPSRWGMALTVAPDFSSTSIGRYSAPGTAYGLFISYRPLPRWQFSTGLIKTAKQYEGYGDEYQPPSGYWENRTNGIVPDEVEGSCGIIEWPLMVRFDLLSKTNSRLYIASGVSSYAMRHESYTYRFAQDNPGAASGWKSSGPTAYAFSIGHLSAGYERSFSNRIAVAIEPYFKIPFKAIGWSNIKLHTTGAYVTVRYTFQKKSIVPTLRNKRQ